MAFWLSDERIAPSKRCAIRISESQPGPGYKVDFKKDFGLNYAIVLVNELAIGFPGLIVVRFINGF